MRFDLIKGLRTAWDVYQNVLGRLLLNVLVTFGVLIIPVVAFFMVSLSVLLRLPSIGAIIVILLLFIGVFGLGLIMQSVPIMIVHNRLNGKMTTYGEDFHSTFTKGLKLMGANILYNLPIMILSVILFVKALDLSIDQIDSLLSYSFVFVAIITLYAMFSMFIGQAIVIEDKGVIDSIKRSFSLVIKNFLKILLCYFIINVVSAIFSYVTGYLPSIIKLIVTIVQLFVSLYVMTFITVLFKQVEEHDDEPLENEQEVIYETIDFE